MMFKMCGIQRDWEARNASTDKGPPPPRPRQMFVTKSQSLVEKVQEDFMKLSESLEMGGLKSADVRTREEPDNEDELFDLDEEVFWSNDLPTEFSALEDKHFPLFITYDHVGLLFFRVDRLTHMTQIALPIIGGELCSR